MLLVLLLAELIALYILSQGLTQTIYNLTLLIFRSRPVGITVVSLLAFPGTVVHELSHLFTAEVLGVRTGKLTLVPEGLETDDVRAGSVMIATSDPFRRYVIGLAPIFVGMITITALSYFIPTLWGKVIDSSIMWYANPSFYYLLLTGYALMAVSNAMFSSKEDLKGFIPFAIALAAMIAAAYFAGLRIGLTGALLAFAERMLDALTKSLGVVLAINIVSFTIAKGFILLTQKVTHRKLIPRSHLR